MDTKQFFGGLSLVVAAVFTVLLFRGLAKREERGERYLALHGVVIVTLALWGIALYLLGIVLPSDF